MFGSPFGTIYFLFIFDFAYLLETYLIVTLLMEQKLPTIEQRASDAKTKVKQ